MVEEPSPGRLEPERLLLDELELELDELLGGVVSGTSSSVSLSLSSSAFWCIEADELLLDEEVVCAAGG